MTNFLRLEVVAVDGDDLFGSTVPDDECRLIPCLHGGSFVVGQAYVRFDTGYVHVGCLDGLVKDLDRESFLIMLARHVAAAPSRHNAGTVRQVINGLVKLLGRTQAERDNALGYAGRPASDEVEQLKADAYAQGAVDTAVAIAEVDGP